MKMTMEELSTKKYLIGLFTFMVISTLLVTLVFSGYRGVFSGDSLEFITVAKYFAGQGEINNNIGLPNLMARLLKPAFPALLAAFSPIFGFNVSFIVINAIFYLLDGFVVFKIVEFLFNDKKQAFVAAILFLTAYPALEYGLSYYIDVGGWFFFLLSVYLTVLFLRTPSCKLVILNGLVVAFGLLVKEYAAPAAAFFGLCLLFINRDSFYRKLKYLVVYSLLILIPFIICQLWVYWRFDYSYYEWFSYNWSVSPTYKHEFLPLFAKSMAATFLLGWLLVLVGMVKFKKMAIENQKLILTLVLPSFSFLAHPAASSRIFYVTGLLLSVIASWGFIWLYREAGRKYLAVILFFLVIVGNYFWFIFDDRLRYLIAGVLGIHY